MEYLVPYIKLLKMIKKKTISVLASHIGVDEEDIEFDDSFTDDLHMNPSEISDFLLALEESDIDTSKIDMTETITVQELIDVLEIEN